MWYKGLSGAVALGLLSVLVACADRSPPAPRKIVDLSPTITEDLPVRMIGHALLNGFGASDSTQFDHIQGYEPLYYVDSYVTLFNHAGPHHDAPNHLMEGAKSSDQFQLDQFFGSARLLDFRSRPVEEPLQVADIQRYGVQPGDIVILFVGYVPPADPEELPSYPVLSSEAAEYLATLPVKALATDMPGVDNVPRFVELAEQGVTGYENLLPVHYAFLSREIPVIEQLVNLESLVGEANVVFVGFPLKIGGLAGGGAPMRAAALVY